MYKRLPLFAVVISLLTACSGASLRDDIVRPEPSYASPPATEGILADIARDIALEHGDEYSGFKLLDGSYDALAWRLALIDSAVSSLDIQTYLWYPDFAGKLILQRAIDAALRGVNVRLVVDDLLTIGQDQLLYELDQLPNVEVRMFNPWKGRGTLSRAGQMIAEFERLNTRMHDKLMIADSRAAIMGGRNLGDHYFGLSSAYNFHDLDALGFGQVALQANDMFDHFWNSEWVISAQNLDVEAEEGFPEERWQALKAENRDAEALKAFGAEPRDWTKELDEVTRELHPGTSYVIFDTASGDEVEQNVAGTMFSFMGLAQEELLITNAYIIPGQAAIDFLASLTARGVNLRILTNSLESHDVPAVNSHYQPWRDDFINAGAELYELRADAAIQSIVEIPPVQGAFVGLHTKAMVADRTMSFIGSMNLDPRSFAINTEAGIFIKSKGLGEDLARVMERDMEPENAWRVLLDEDGKPYWVNSDETVYRQPARDGTQRIMDKIFKIFPKEQY
jgi:putative cardiolipin synthase